MTRRLIYASMVFTAICIMIFSFKPALMFDRNDNIRRFGTETCFSVGVVTTVTAVLCFYVFAIQDFIREKKKGL